ncbi:MAG: hypothetical protein IIX64_05915 [Bacteroidales bacterium]|nr:hypothetical protein [Bacteroidales bacterium]
MKKSDGFLLLCVALVAALFVFVPQAGAFYNQATASHPVVMSFFKFAILSTLGEMIGLRIRRGVYVQKGFGVLPRMLIWGVLGVFIWGAMVVFKAGTLKLYELLGAPQAAQWFASEGFSWGKLCVAFSVSVLMNSFFAPVFMTFHKITDTHIQQTGGTLFGFFSTPIPVGKIIAGLDWKTQWGFVFKKTIPLFWYPAHTLTFMLPSNYQVLFAAFLGVALGVILAIANNKRDN